MHVDHPWNVTLTSRLFPSGSLFVSHLPRHPHPMLPHDLGLSLTDNWNVAWKSPFSAHLCYLSSRGPRPPRPSPRCRPHVGYLHLRILRDTGLSPLCTQPLGPHHNCGQRRGLRIVRYTLQYSNVDRKYKNEWNKLHLIHEGEVLFVLNELRKLRFTHSFKSFQ